MAKIWFAVSEVSEKRLRWLGQLFRRQEKKPCGKLTLHKPVQLGRIAIRWLESIEGDMKLLVFRNWRRNTQDPDQWRANVEGAKFRCGLQYQQRKKIKQI
jgi:hypothetical protein